MEKYTTSPPQADSKYASDKPITHVTVQIKSKPIHEHIRSIEAKEQAIVSLGDVVLHAISKSLKEFPEFNSNFKNNLEIFEDLDIGYAINLGQGTKTCIIADAGSKSISDISKEIKVFALQYLHKELLDVEVKTCTFLVTNFSSFNSFIVETPLYKNHSSILAISSEFDSYEMINGSMMPLKKFNVTLSYDSRAADCQRALLFLDSIRIMLENMPESIRNS